MSHNHQSTSGFALIITSLILLLAAFALVTTARAQEPIPLSENSNCVVCHENLYLLHDTGNHFCLCESPMTCVTCHGGDPTALTKEAAHAVREPHPVVGEDLHRCQVCHPDECVERAAIFDQKAGISDILIVPTFDVATVAQAATIETAVEPVEKANFWRVLPVLVLILGSISMGIWINKDYHPGVGA